MVMAVRWLGRPRCNCGGILDSSERALRPAALRPSLSLICWYNTQPTPLLVLHLGTDAPHDARNVLSHTGAKACDTT